MENRGSDGQFPVAQFERRDNRVLPMRSQQIRDCGCRLHCMLKIVECRIARLKSRIDSMKEIKRKRYQIIAQACLRTAESISQNPVDEFRCSKIALGMEHLI